MEEPEGKRLYIGNLPYNVNERELHDRLHEKFSTLAAIESIDLMKDKLGGQLRGFGFVTLMMASDAAAVVEGLNGKVVCGRSLRVAIAKPREEGNSGGRRRERGPDDWRREERASHGHARRH